MKIKTQKQQFSYDQHVFLSPRQYACQMKCAPVVLCRNAASQSQMSKKSMAMVCIQCMYPIAKGANINRRAEDSLGDFTFWLSLWLSLLVEPKH